MYLERGIELPLPHRSPTLYLYTLTNSKVLLNITHPLGTCQKSTYWQKLMCGCKSLLWITEDPFHLCCYYHLGSSIPVASLDTNIQYRTPRSAFDVEFIVNQLWSTVTITVNQVCIFCHKSGKNTLIGYCSVIFFKVPNFKAHYSFWMKHQTNKKRKAKKPQGCSDLGLVNLLIWDLRQVTSWTLVFSSFERSKLENR